MSRLNPVGEFGVRPRCDDPLDAVMRYQPLKVNVGICQKCQSVSMHTSEKDQLTSEKDQLTQGKDKAQCIKPTKEKGKVLKEHYDCE